jgi:hypothetical protein
MPGSDGNLSHISIGNRPRIIFSQLKRGGVKRASSRFQYGLSYVCGSSEGYKVNSRMGCHSGPKIMAAGHDIENTRYCNHYNRSTRGEYVSRHDQSALDNCH